MVTSVWVTSLVLLLATFKNAEGVSNENVGEPLFLTPLIEAGQLATARNFSRVYSKAKHSVSYAGFLTVNETYNANLFFRYFPAKVNPVTAPVLLYLEDGPGLSILISNSKIHTKSWIDNHHVIYIENPIGTGYSFADDDAAYPDGQIQIANDWLNALVQFFKMFPNLRTNDFFVTGEFYAGKHVPAVCNAIHNWNPTTRTDKINLKGMAISSGLTDPINQLIFGEFFYNIGYLDENGKNRFLFRERRIQALIERGNHAEAFNVVQQLFESPENLFQNLTRHQLSHYIFMKKIDSQLRNKINHIVHPQMRRFFHVGNRTFVPYSIGASEYLKNDFTRSQADLVKNLLEHYRVLVYTGDSGVLVNYPGVQNYLNNLNWSGAQEWKIAERKPWRVYGKVAGWIKKVDNLTAVTVLSAGDFVHTHKPATALKLVHNFFRDKL